MTKPISKSTTWSPGSWRSRIIKQQPVYPDHEHLKDALHRLAKLPPLVTSWEIENLKCQLAEAADGRAFLLQGGDCSENLDDCEQYPENRLYFSFGETIKSVEDKLYEKDLILKYKYKENEQIEE